jgi:hypothetical protein
VVAGAEVADRRLALLPDLGVDPVERTVQREVGRGGDRAELGRLEHVELAAAVHAAAALIEPDPAPQALAGGELDARVDLLADVEFGRRLELCRGVAVA